MSDDDWVTVEGIRYVPEAPLKAEIDRLWIENSHRVSQCHDLNEMLEDKEAEIARLRDLLAWNRIDPDAVIESAKGADNLAKEGK